MADITINNSSDNAVMSGKWKNPGATFYDKLLECSNWRSLIKEAYLMSGKINNNPHDGNTSFSRSGCKYPHHVIKDDSLVVSKPGVMAAYSRARQMGVFNGKVKNHLMKHIRELGITVHIDEAGDVYIDEEAESMMIIEENFNDINLYLMERSGINLFQEDFEVLFERPSTKKLQIAHRLGRINDPNDPRDGHRVHIIYDLNGDWELTQNNTVDTEDFPNKVLSKRLKIRGERDVGEGSTDRSEIAILRRYGNTDFQSRGQKVLAIVDLDERDPKTKKHITLKTAKCSGPFGGENNYDSPPVTLTVGERDMNKSFKSTYWDKREEFNDPRHISKREGHRTRGVEGAYITRFHDPEYHDAFSTDKEIDYLQSQLKDILDVIKNPEKRLSELEKSLDMINKGKRSYIKISKSSCTADAAVDRLLSDSFKNKEELERAITLLREDIKSNKNFKQDPSVRKMLNSINEDIKIFADARKDEKATKARWRSGANPRNKKNKVKTESVDFSEDIDNTPQGLFNWMNHNVKYDHALINWKLKAPSELLKNKIGNCHDQSLFELFMLRKMGYEAWQLFFIEFKEDNDKGGNTHTLTYFKDNNKYYWIENAWESYAGIHGPYYDIDEIKEAIIEIYDEDDDINSGEYDGIAFASHHNYQIGMNLHDYVNSWEIDDDRLFASDDSLDFKYYRVEYNGAGVYEALRQAIPMEDWKTYLTDGTFNWLPKPPEYLEGYRSWFTQEGYSMFLNKVAPLIKKYLDPNLIEVKYSKSIAGKIVYEDEYQIVVDTKELIDEYFNWIESFVHDEVFRESIESIELANELMDFEEKSNGLLQVAHRLAVVDDESSPRHGHKLHIIYDLNGPWELVQNNVANDDTKYGHRSTEHITDDNGYIIREIGKGPLGKEGRMQIRKLGNTDFCSKGHMVKSIIDLNADYYNKHVRRRREPMIDRIVREPIKCIGPTSTFGEEIPKEIQMGKIDNNPTFKSTVWAKTLNGIKRIEGHTIKGQASLRYRDTGFLGKKNEKILSNIEDEEKELEKLKRDLETNTDDSKTEYLSYLVRSKENRIKKLKDSYQRIYRDWKPGKSIFDESENIDLGDELIEFDEKSNGLLQVAHRLAIIDDPNDPRDGHQVHIIYDLNGDWELVQNNTVSDQTGVGHRETFNGPMGKEGRMQIRKLGNTDFMSKGHLVKAIKDLDDGNKIIRDKIKCIGPCAKGNIDKYQATPVDIQMGTIDNNPLFKSTLWNDRKFYNFSSIEGHTIRSTKGQKIFDYGRIPADKKDIEGVKILKEIFKEIKTSIDYNQNDLFRLRRRVPDEYALPEEKAYVDKLYNAYTQLLTKAVWYPRLLILDKNLANQLRRFPHFAGFNYKTGDGVLYADKKLSDIDYSLFSYKWDLDKNNIEKDIEDWKKFKKNWRPHKESTDMKSEGFPEVDPKITKTTNPNDPESSKAVNITFYDEEGNKVGEASISAIDTPNAFMYNVEVFPEYRGKGYGNSIVAWCLENYPVTEVTVEPDNDIAIHLYKKFGFTKHMDYEENGKKYIDMRRNSTRDDIDVNNIDDLIINYSTPNELYEWMKNIDYGWLDKSGKKNGTSDHDDTHHFFDEYIMQSPDELIQSKIGVCWDQVELARQWFDGNDYDHAVICVEVKDGDDCPTHSFIVYKDNNKIYWFEGAWKDEGGSHEYNSLKECLEDVTSKLLEDWNTDREFHVYYLKNPPKPGCTCQEYYDITESSPEIDLEDISDIFESVEYLQEKKITENKIKQNFENFLKKYKFNEDDHTIVLNGERVTVDPFYWLPYTIDPYGYKLSGDRFTHVEIDNDDDYNPFPIIVLDKNFFKLPPRHMQFVLLHELGHFKAQYMSKDGKISFLPHLKDKNGQLETREKLKKYEIPGTHTTVEEFEADRYAVNRMKSKKDMRQAMRKLYSHEMKDDIRNHNKDITKEIPENRIRELHQLNDERRASLGMEPFPYDVYKVKYPQRVRRSRTKEAKSRHKEYRDAYKKDIKNRYNAIKDPAMDDAKYLQKESTEEYSDMGDMLIEESPSRKLLKVDYRVAIGVSPESIKDHMIQIIYSLDNMELTQNNIVYVKNKDGSISMERKAHKLSTKEIGRGPLGEEGVELLKKYGNTDHQSKNQRIMVIKDYGRMENDRIVELKNPPEIIKGEIICKSIFANRNSTEYTIKAGMIETVPTYKSTYWDRDPNKNIGAFLGVREEISGRGLRLTRDMDYTGGDIHNTTRTDKRSVSILKRDGRLGAEREDTIKRNMQSAIDQIKNDQTGLERIYHSLNDNKTDQSVDKGLARKEIDDINAFNKKYRSQLIHKDLFIYYNPIEIKMFSKDLSIKTISGIKLAIDLNNEILRKIEKIFNSIEYGTVFLATDDGKKRIDAFRKQWSPRNRISVNDVKMNESVSYHEVPPNHQGYTLDTLPDVMYFAAPEKHEILKGDKLFLTPYIGIASIFIINTDKAIRDEFKKRTGEYPHRTTFNTSYKEWNMESQDLDHPLKTIHVTHNIPGMKGKFTGSAKGYIHFVDISDIKDDLKVFVTNDPDREVYYTGGKDITPIKIIPHSVKFEMDYDEENARAHGQGIVESVNYITEEDESIPPMPDKPPSMGDEPIEGQKNELPTYDTDNTEEEIVDDDKNGNERKELYEDFISYAKEKNNKNIFGNVFDKDAFTKVFSFVPEEMRYFYRISNPLLCVLDNHLTFFALSELKKINEEIDMSQYIIFAATESEIYLFNVKNKCIYSAIDEDGTIKLQEKLADSFDEYIEDLINE